MNIKETVKTPSAALQYMVDGLRKQAKRPDFKINMCTFGGYEEGICYGCAATCAIQEIAGKNLEAKKSIEYVQRRSEELGFISKELDLFEGAIDDARTGELWGLFKFFDLVDDFGKQYDKRFFLGTDNWESELPKVELLIKELKEKGL